MINDEFGKGNRSILRKPAPVPLCPPQIPHDLTRAATMRNRRLIAWATERPQGPYLYLGLRHINAWYIIVQNVCVRKENIRCIDVESFMSLGGGPSYCFSGFPSCQLKRCLPLINLLMDSWEKQLCSWRPLDRSSLLSWFVRSLCCWIS
jgi:hypothetical protein